MKNFAAALMLAIGAYAANPFIGGELHSHQKYTYGKFVARMKPTMLKGTGSAFYLFDRDNDYKEQNVYDEWNSMYIIPSHHHEPIVTRMSQHKLGEEKGNWASHNFSGDRDDFHDYTIVWTPEYLAYYVDDTEVRRNDDVSLLQSDELNLALAITALEGEDYGNPDPEKMPTYTHIDYVEVYSYDEAEKSFELEYRDDFNSLNYDMWNKANGQTWIDIVSTFDEDNVYVEDGHLLLRLDKNADYDHDKSNDDDDDHDGDGEHSDDHDESDHDHHDFHVLPAPKEGSLDRAIEKATRVAVTMVRTYLDEFAESMSHHYQHYEQH